MKLYTILAVLCVGVFAVTASAAPAIIDFSTGAVPADNGTIAWLGGAAPLTGSDIAIGQVRGVATPSNAGSVDNICAGAFPCAFPANVGGRLDFTTGAFISYTAGTDTYAWGAGGSLTITGFGPGCTTLGGCGGNAPNTQSGPALLTGSVISATYQDGAFDVVLAAGNDTKDVLLTNFFGLDPTFTYDFSGTVHAAINNQPGGKGTAFTGASTASTDIRNQAVPELGSIMLLGTILVGTTNLLRRRLAKR